MEGAGWQERHDQEFHSGADDTRVAEQASGAGRGMRESGARGGSTREPRGSLGGRVLATVQGPQKITRRARRWHEVGPGPASI